MKELSKNNSLTSPKTIDLSNPDKVNAMVKKQYYGYGSSNKKFQSKLNKLLN